MWIRSQDKRKLLKAGEIWLQNLSNGWVEINSTTTSNSDSCLMIGSYKTEERAIEVIGEIQSQIIYETPVFQMPKE